MADAPSPSPASASASEPTPTPTPTPTPAATPAAPAPPSAPARAPSRPDRSKLDEFLLGISILIVLFTLLIALIGGPAPALDEVRRVQATVWQKPRQGLAYNSSDMTVAVSVANFTFTTLLDVRPVEGFMQDYNPPLTKGYLAGVTHAEAVNTTLRQPQPKSRANVNVLLITTNNMTNCYLDRLDVEIMLHNADQAQYTTVLVEMAENCNLDPVILNSNHDSDSDSSVMLHVDRVALVSTEEANALQGFVYRNETRFVIVTALHPANWAPRFIWWLYVFPLFNFSYRLILYLQLHVYFYIILFLAVARFQLVQSRTMQFKLQGHAERFIKVGVGPNPSPIGVGGFAVIHKVQPAMRLWIRFCRLERIFQSAWDAKAGVLAVKEVPFQANLRGKATPAKLKQICIEEINHLAQLKSPECATHVVQIFSYEVTESYGRILMECGRVSLEKVLNEVPLNGPQVKYIWNQILAALHCIHTRGIVHFDIKPGNFVYVGQNLKLIDFGTAKTTQALEANRAVERAPPNVAAFGVGGTRGYWSPEVLAGDLQRVGVRSDVWSAGALLYNLLFRASPLAHIEGLPVVQMREELHEFGGIEKFPSQSLADSDPEFIAVMKKCFRVYEARPEDVLTLRMEGAAEVFCPV